MTDWLIMTCVACPTILEGEAPDGRYVRLRYRYGVCSVMINDETFYRATHGDKMDGVMEFSKALHIAEAVWRENPAEPGRCPECKRSIQMMRHHKLDCSRGR